MGTGTGALSIAIAKNFNNTKILATDINPAALKIALKNAKLNNVEHIIKFKKSNWFSNIKNIKFDFIISNPPYLSKKILHTIMIFKILKIAYILKIMALKI